MLCCVCFVVYRIAKREREVVEVVIVGVVLEGVRTCCLKVLLLPFVVIFVVFG